MKGRQFKSTVDQALLPILAVMNRFDLACGRSFVTAKVGGMEGLGHGCHKTVCHPFEASGLHTLKIIFLNQ